MFTDHKPLCTALASSTERSQRQTRHLSFIAEFTSDIKHIKGIDNHTADALSRVNTVTAANAVNTVAYVNYGDLAQQQLASEELQNFRHEQSSLTLEYVDFDGHRVLCDTSTGRQRPVVPLY